MDSLELICYKIILINNINIDKSYGVIYTKCQYLIKINTAPYFLSIIIK